MLVSIKEITSFRLNGHRNASASWKCITNYIAGRYLPAQQTSFVCKFYFPNVVPVLVLW